MVAGSLAHLEGAISLRSHDSARRDWLRIASGAFRARPLASSPQPRYAPAVGAGATSAFSFLLPLR